MVPERLVFLFAINITANLIGFTNSGTEKEESVSIATTPPYSQYVPLDQQETGTAGRESTKTKIYASRLKDLKPAENVDKFETLAGLTGSSKSKNKTTFGIFVREPIPSDLGLPNRKRIVLRKKTAKTRPLVKRNTTKIDDVNVELGRQSKIKREAIPTLEKLRRKRAKRTKKLGETRKYEQLPPTKPISVNARIKNIEKPRKGPNEEAFNESIGRSYKGLIMNARRNQGQSAVQKTTHEGLRQKREARRPRYLIRPLFLRPRYRPRDYYDYYGGFDYYPEKHEEQHKEHQEEHKEEHQEEHKEEHKEEHQEEHQEEGETGDTRQRRKEPAKGPTKPKPKQPQKVKHTKIKKGRHRWELNDYDDKEYFDGGRDHIHHGHHHGELEFNDYDYLHRTKRDSGDGKERSISLSSPTAALDHVRDTLVRFGAKVEVKIDNMKQTGVRRINIIGSHKLKLGVNSNETGVNGTAVKPVNQPVASNRTTSPATVKVPTPPVMIALCSEKVCANGGTCLRSAIRGIICLCPTGYSGKTCENRSDPCIRHPCQNGATCIFADKTLPMRCECPAGFTGKLCQIDVNECSSDPCLNGARCMDHVDGYSCKCLLGFEGQRCEANTNDCLGRICANGGRCIDGLNRYRCQCRPGFFGRHCQRVSDACLRRPCFNGGECIAMDSRGHFYKCLCRTGYLGSRCEIQAAKCVHNWCKKGGTCMEAAGSFQCLCPSGLTGNLCESEVNFGVHKCQPDVCQRHGTCVDTFPGYRCECPIEAVGDKCQFDRDACLPNPCVNGGQCIPTGGSLYFCLCDQRFAGKICQFETRPCAGNKTCENGGTCLEYHLQRRLNSQSLQPCVGKNCRSVKQNARKQLTVIRCVCPLLYTGPRCTVRNTPCAIGVCGEGQECKEDPHSPIEGYSCLDKNQSQFSLKDGKDQSMAVQEASPGHERWVKVVNAAAILFGAAMIIAMFRIAFVASGYGPTYFRSKKDIVYRPVEEEQWYIASDIRTPMKNPRM